LLAQFAEIIDFAVVDDSDRAGLVPDGLRATGQINDAEPPRAGHDRRSNEDPLFIGAAMNDGGEHSPDYGFAVFLGVKSDGTANSTHRVSSAFCLRRRSYASAK
jgi:hypothetical protein